MFKLNKSHINREVVKKVLSAVKSAPKELGEVSYVLNKKGKPFIRAEVVETPYGDRVRLMDKSGQDVGQLVVEGALYKLGMLDDNTLGNLGKIL